MVIGSSALRVWTWNSHNINGFNIQLNQRLWTTPSLDKLLSHIKCLIQHNWPGTHCLYTLLNKNTENPWITHPRTWWMNLWGNQLRPKNGAGHCHEPEGTQGPLHQHLYWPCKDTLSQNITDPPQTAHAGGCPRKQNALHSVSRLMSANGESATSGIRWQMPTGCLRSFCRALADCAF